MLKEGRSYTIIGQDLQFALSIFDVNDPLIVGLPDGSNNQKWIATREASGSWILKNVASGKFLSIEGEPRDRTRLIGADSPTLWRIERGGEGPDSYWILTEDSALAVGFLPVRVFPPPVALEDGTRQAWKFVEARPL